MRFMRLSGMVAVFLMLILCSGAVSAELDAEPQHDEVSLQCELAGVYMFHAQHDRAIAAFTKAIQLDSKCAGAYVGRAEAFGEKGLFREAFAGVEEAIRIDPDGHAAYRVRGDLYGKQGKTKEAIASYTQAIRRSPRDPILYGARARAFSEAGEFGKANADLDRQIEFASPGVPKFWAYLERGELHTAHGEHEKAIRDFTAAIAEDVGYVRAYLLRGDRHAAKGDFDKAIADYSEAVKLWPDSSAVYGSRGAIREQVQDYRGACEDFSDVIRLDPKDVHAWNHRGHCHLNLGNLENAITDFSEAIRLRPNKSSYYGARATAHIDSSDFRQGIKDLEDAIRLNPNDAGAKYDPAAKRELAADMLGQGRQQVRRMLKDRPAMAQHCDEGDALWEWAARKFAGEDIGRPIGWDAGELPMGMDAAHRRPAPNQPALIRVRRSYAAGPQAGTDRSFEELWNNVIFELHNVNGARRFRQLEDDARAGKLAKEQYVMEMWRTEYRAQQRTRAFYVRLFLPWAEKKKLPTDPIWWFATSWENPDDFPKKYTDRSAFPWVPYGDYYDRIRAAAKTQ